MISGGVELNSFNNKLIRLIIKVKFGDGLLTHSLSVLPQEQKSTRFFPLFTCDSSERFNECVHYNLSSRKILIAMKNLNLRTGVSRKQSTLNCP